MQYLPEASMNNLVAAASHTLPAALAKKRTHKPAKSDPSVISGDAIAHLPRTANSENSIRLCTGLSSDPVSVYRFARARGKKARQSATYDSDSAAKRRRPHIITDGRAQIMISFSRRRADNAFCLFPRESLIKITPVTPFCAR